MALNAADFYPLGPIRSADIQQFVDLFTGVMTDQPITFKNTLTVGSAQGAANAPLKLYGAVGQTSDLIDLYPDPTSAQPTFGFGASGRFGWGAGGTAVPDTFMSRIGTQNGHATDTAGLFIQPNLEISGTLILDGPLSFQGGGDLKNFSGNTLELDTNLIIPGHLWFDTGLATGIVYNGGALALDPTVLVHQANAQGSGLGYANAHLQVRSDDIDGTTTNSQVMGFSAQTWSGNWLQFNTRFLNTAANGGWGAMALGLNFDVDNSPGAGGAIWMLNQRVGINGLPTPSGDTLQVQGNATIAGDLNANGHLASANGNLYVGAEHVWDGGANTLFMGSSLNIQSASGLYIGPQNRRLYYDSGTQCLHFDWDLRIDSAHDVFTHSIHLVTTGDDCRIDTIGDMNYYGPNGSTNHRFHHVDGSWMGMQAANFSPQSALQYKTDIHPIEDRALALICEPQLRGIGYTRKHDGTHRLGFIADYWEEFLPEAVSRNRDTGEVETMEYDMVVPILWEVVRRLAQEAGLCR